MQQPLERIQRVGGRSRWLSPAAVDHSLGTVWAWSPHRCRFEHGVQCHRVPERCMLVQARRDRRFDCNSAAELLTEFAFQTLPVGLAGLDAPAGERPERRVVFASFSDEQYPTLIPDECLRAVPDLQPTSSVRRNRRTRRTRRVGRRSQAVVDIRGPSHDIVVHFCRNFTSLDT